MAIVNYLIKRVLYVNLSMVSFWHFARLSSCFYIELYKRKENGIWFQCKCLLFILFHMSHVDIILSNLWNLLIPWFMDDSKKFMVTIWI